MGVKRIELSSLALEASFLPLEILPIRLAGVEPAYKRSTVVPVSDLAQTENAPGWTRTSDLLLIRQAYYRLYYECYAPTGIRTQFLRLKASNDLPITLWERIVPNRFELLFQPSEG